MTQYDFGTISPDDKSGAELAADLNNWREALHSTHRGSERPSYVLPGMLWIDDSADPVWKLKLWNGNEDLDLGLGAFRAADASGPAALRLAEDADNGPNTVTLKAPASIAANYEVEMPPAAGVLARLADLAAMIRTDVPQAFTAAQKRQARINAGAIFVDEYVSAQQTITSGGLLTLAHGMGGRPKIIITELICLSSGDGEYVAGDRVFIGPSFNTRADTGRGHALLADATNIYVRYGNNAQAFEVIRKGDGTALVLNNVRWQLIVKAWA